MYMPTSKMFVSHTTSLAQKVRQLQNLQKNGENWEKMAQAGQITLIGRVVVVITSSVLYNSSFVIIGITCVNKASKILKLYMFNN